MIAKKEGRRPYSKSGRNLIKSWKVHDTFSPNACIILFHGDATEFLKTVPDKSVALVVTSPPYNIGKVYERRTGIEEYLAVQSRFISQLHRILKDNGSICWQ